MGFVVESRMPPRFSDDALPEVGVRVAWVGNPYWAGVVVGHHRWCVDEVHVVDVRVRMRSVLGNSVVRVFDPTDLVPAGCQWVKDWKGL